MPGDDVPESGRVVRAAPLDVAAWRLPDPDKAALVSRGVPLIDELVEAVSFRAEATVYRLATYRIDRPGLTCQYGAVPGTGEVLETWIAGGRSRFVNSSIRQWLSSLDLVDIWLTTSVAVGRWDEDEEAEESALAELAVLLERITALDPAAYGSGDHWTHFWPAVLDRWLY